jgi:hypothetical protein
MCLTHLCLKFLAYSHIQQCGQPTDLYSCNIVAIKIILNRRPYGVPIGGYGVWSYWALQENLICYLFLVLDHIAFTCSFLVQFSSILHTITNKLLQDLKSIICVNRARISLSLNSYLAVSLFIYPKFPP